jgi:hypothetical protein
MKKYLCLFFICFLIFNYHLALSESALKFVMYDFDGLDIGQTDLPDGDFRNGDLQYHVSVNPLGASEVPGDRCLKINLNWQGGRGEFGKSLLRFFELNSSTDYINFYLYNPPANGTDAVIHILIPEDDNGDGIYEDNADDKWIAAVTVSPASNWQLISIPLSSFRDSSIGGNGIFDAGFTGNGGLLFSVSFIFYSSGSATSAEYYMDMICFSEGPLPTGNSILDLPATITGSQCLLGALANNDNPIATPSEVEGLFPNGKKIQFVNWFVDYSKTGTTPNAYPGNEVSTLLQGGYRPVITWETMYSSYARLDAVQPRLDAILNGSFDSYIDAFADRIKNYNDTIIIRILHEFDGNWYPWSLAENGGDASKYISAYRHIVDRFRMRGAYNAQWMWCVNAEPKPYSSYNWVISCYPGDAYVDIVATDIYNHPDPGIPAWKSFRLILAEVYHYLTRYFPQKPFYICEAACRERYSGEDMTSQTKAQWLCEMKKELQTYFQKVQALIFFCQPKEHDWRMNSSDAALNAMTECFWKDDYFGDPQQLFSHLFQGGGLVYPNPFITASNVIVDRQLFGNTEFEMTICDPSGKNIYSKSKLLPGRKILFGEELLPGIYFVRMKNEFFTKTFKVVKV